MDKIPCGGFYVDPQYLSFAKDENGHIYMSVVHEALTGIQGPKGDKGDPFSISKIYKSISEMEADHSNPEVAIDSFVIIENEEHTEDNGKLYIKDVNGFDYITDLSTGTMIEGPKGNDGVGVPTGGTIGQVLTKISDDEDYVTEWATLPDVGVVVYSSDEIKSGNNTFPKLTTSQMHTIYNSFIAGKHTVISNLAGTKHYSVIGVDSSDGENVTAKILYEDKGILFYNNSGTVQSYTPIASGEVVTYSREYGTAPNDHGYVREWSPNLQGKVWAECGVFITTVALSVGSRVPLPVTFEDGNFHVQVTVLELGNYAATAYPSGDSRSINVRVHDYYGTPKAVKICVEAKGWKKI